MSLFIAGGVSHSEKLAPSQILSSIQGAKLKV